MPIASCQSWWPGVSRQCHTPLRGNYQWTRTSDIKFSNKKPCHNSPNTALHLSGPHSIPLLFGVFSSEPSIHPLFSHCLSHCLCQGIHLHQLAAVLVLPVQKNRRVEAGGPSAQSTHVLCNQKRTQHSPHTTLMHGGKSLPSPHHPLLHLSSSLTLCLGEWYLLCPTAWEWLPDSSIFLIPLHEIH